VKSLVVAVFVAGSIRETLSSRLFATHTEPKPASRAEGRPPTGIVAVTVGAAVAVGMPKISNTNAMLARASHEPLPTRRG
jgi:hypothetical protein